MTIKIDMDKINKIIHGDTIEELKKMPDKSIDLIFADPPYWMQTEGELLRTDGSKFSGVNDAWDKFSSFEEYDNFTFQWLKECKRVLKDSGSIWVIGSFQNIFRLGYIMQNLGFWILNDVIWNKPNAVPNFGGTRFKNAHETLIWCSKSKNSKFTFNYKTMKFLNNDIQDKSVWDIGICIGNERLKDETGSKVHSTQKPEKLLYKVILSSSKPNDIILDPFMGSGTTGAVAKKLGRNFVGIEREEKYIKAANKRIEKVLFENNDLHNLKYEIKPPKISTKQLIDNGYLKINEELFDKKGKFIGYLTENGYVNDKIETLSIHKMAAKHKGVDNYNGWDFFWIKNKNNKLISIDELRYICNSNIE
ncbi:DNA-methyltransferase [Mycoplasmopsis caviae]|uniref:Methyltransferase n=1 Tax=Mycoplasmopsis caviae TaxID=55603 RepID=A0A3P8KBK7_9BACT|nr:site-specific DNA-methyltransferase [Mycoplasmopsis caviae]VDR41974.1 Modification methylase HpaI [Mycoplasmopsis caviae]